MAHINNPHKLVLVVRTDLNMTKGKIAAQCSHATLACYKTAVKNNYEGLKTWELEGQAKIALRVENEQELLKLFEISRQNGLISELIRDAGRTQIKYGETTCLGIGPGRIEEIDKITGQLKLL